MQYQECHANLMKYPIAYNCLKMKYPKLKDASIQLN